MCATLGCDVGLAGRAARQLPAQNAQPAGQPLVVDGRITEEQLRRLGAAEVQMGGVLPGKPDAAVHLDVLCRSEHVRLRAADVRRRGGDRELRCSLIRQPAASRAMASASSTRTSMSAHLCLTAWKEPMARPNWNRVLGYPALISRHLLAPQACSAASATQARSSTRLISLPPWPSAPIKAAGTWSKVRTAIARVGSSAVICATASAPSSSASPVCAACSPPTAAGSTLTHPLADRARRMPGPWS
jgi:hypothetical protein